MSDEYRLARLEAQVAHLYEHLGLSPDGAFRGGAQTSTDAELLRLINDGRKIEAIKRYRELTGAGLGEAKDAVEQLERRYSLG
jgi:ribosomal protein L7/L12